MNPNTLEHMSVIFGSSIRLTPVFEEGRKSKNFISYPLTLPIEKKTEGHHQRKKQGHYHIIHAALRIQTAIVYQAMKRLLKQ